MAVDYGLLGGAMAGVGLQSSLYGLVVQRWVLVGQLSRPSSCNSWKRFPP